MSDEKETAKCRGCGQELRGEPYYKGGAAYHPDTGERCKVNHYGGFVCSETCDRNSSVRLETSMPGGPFTQLSCYAQARLDGNWSQ